MHTLDEVVWDAAKNETLRFGVASWSTPPAGPWYSVKYAWRDARGHVCRGGEVPSEATAAMFALAIKHHAIERADISPNDLAVIRSFVR